MIKSPDLDWFFIYRISNKRLRALVPWVYKKLKEQKRLDLRFINMMGQLYKIMPEQRDKITDMDIQALVDGELSEEARLHLLGIIGTSPELQQRYRLYQHQKNLLKMWHKDN